MNVISELQRKLGLLRTGKVDDLLFTKLGVTFPCDSTTVEKITTAIQACKFSEPYQSGMIGAVVTAALAKTPIVELPPVKPAPTSTAKVPVVQLAKPELVVRPEPVVRLVPMMEPITITGPVTPLPGVATHPEGDVKPEVEKLDDTTELPLVEEPKVEEPKSQPKPQPKPQPKKSRKGKKA